MQSCTDQTEQCYGKAKYERCPCVGDHFEWFVNNCVPEKYTIEANQKDIDIHELLSQKAESLRIGESGLIALDWWNGNRSVLVDDGPVMNV